MKIKIIKCTPTPESTELGVDIWYKDKIGLVIDTYNTLLVYHDGEIYGIKDGDYEILPQEVGKMVYPEAFIQKCKEVYPTWTELHQRLEAGDVFAGRYLDDSRYGLGVSSDDILNATSLPELQAKVRNHQLKVELYSEWCDMYDKQFKGR